MRDIQNARTMRINVGLPVLIGLALACASAWAGDQTPGEILALGEFRWFIRVGLVLIGVLAPIAGAVYFMLSSKPVSSHKRAVPPLISSVPTRSASHPKWPNISMRVWAAAAGLGACDLVLLIVVAIIFCLPWVYEGHVRIQIGAPGDGAGQRQWVAALLQTHAQQLQSESVLIQVVKAEKLVTQRGYEGPEELAARQCAGFLKQHVTAQPVYGANLIEVVVSSIDPDAVAPIGNRIAKIYCNSALRSKGETISIAKRATPPRYPSHPNISLCLGVGLLGGLILGATVSGLILWLDRTRRSRITTAC